MDMRNELLFEPPEIGCALSLMGLPGGGSTIFDGSPYGNQGMITGATWKWTPGGLWCLSFDGADDYASLGAGKFDALTQCSVELWFRPDIDLDAQATHRTLFNFYKDADHWIQV